MARQFVVQLKNQPGALAVLAEELASARRRPAGDRRREHRRFGPRDHDHGRRRRRPRRSSTRATTSTSRVRRSWPRSATDRAAWRAVARELADAGVNIQGHLFLGRWGDRAMFTFVVDKPEVARPILERKP